MGVAGFTLRQMEFDADQYEARFAGSKAFATTSQRLQELGVGMQMAYSQLGSSHQEGRLVDDIPALTRLNAARLPKEAQQMIKEQYENGTTGLFATHPCDNDRVENAMAAEASGVFHLTAPASELFSDFTAQSKATTWEFYREVFGDQVKKSSLDSVDQLNEAHEKQEAADKRLSGYYQQTARARRVLLIRSGFLSPPQDARAALEQLKSARQTVESNAEQARKLLEKYDEAENRLSEALVFEAFHNAKIGIDKRSLDKAMLTREGARSVQRQCRREMGEVRTKLAEYDKQLAQRLRLALELLQVDQVVAKLKDGQHLQERSETLLPAMVAIDGQMETLQSLSSADVMLGALVRHMQSMSEPTEEMVGAADRITDRVQPQLLQVREVLTNLAYPFDHKGRQMTLGAFVLPKAPTRHDIGALIEAVSEITDRTLTTRRRVLGELAMIAEQVEAVFGMAPLPEVEAPQEEET